MSDRNAGVCRLDPGDLRLVDANDAFCRQFDADREALVGRSLTELYAFDESALDESALDESALADTTGTRVRATPRRNDHDATVSLQFWRSGDELVTVVGQDDDQAADGPTRVRQLHHGATRIVAADTVTEAYRTAIDAAESVLGFEVCVVYTAGDEKFHLTAASETAFDIPETLPLDWGVLSKTHRTGESVLVSDAADDAVSHPEHDQYTSLISVPFGPDTVFQAISTDPGYYTQRDLELAELLAIHVEQARRSIESQRDIEGAKTKIERLHAVATELEACTTHDELYPVIVDAAEEILEFDWCTVAIVENGWFELKAVSEDAPVAAGERHIRVGEGLAGHVLEQGEPGVVDDTQAHPISEPTDDAIRSSLTVPVGDVGVLEGISQQTGAFDPDDAELAELLAAHLAEAYDRIEMERQLRERQRELNLLKQVQSRVLRHNIRNDLNIIIGAAKTLPDPDANTVSGVREKILRTGRRLLSTSEKARRIETVVDNDDDTTEVDLVDVLEDLLSTARAEYPEATVEADLPDSVVVTVPPNISTAIYEVIENGIIHDPGDPAVTVELEDADTEVVVRVRDTGPGIPDGEITVLEQEHESVLEHGTGAGLWLTKLVVYKVGGDVSFTSSQDGTTAHVHIPRTDG